MKTLTQLFCGAFLFAVSSNLCLAQIEVYSDEEVFLSNVEDFNLESFEMNETTSKSTEPINTQNMTVSISGAVQAIVNQGGGGELPTDGDQTLTAELGPLVLHFELIRPTRVLGLNISDFGDVGDGGNLVVATDDGNAFQIATTPGSTLPNNNNMFFFGLITNEPISERQRSSRPLEHGVFFNLCEVVCRAGISRGHNPREFSSRRGWQRGLN